MASLVYKGSIPFSMCDQLIGHSVASMKSLSCMSFLRNDNGEILVAGHQNTMFRIGLELGIVMEEVALSHCSFIIQES